MLEEPKKTETVSCIEGHTCHNDAAVAIRITALNDSADCPAGDSGETYARNQQAHEGSLLLQNSSSQTPENHPTTEPPGEGTKGREEGGL